MSHIRYDSDVYYNDYTYIRYNCTIQNKQKMLRPQKIAPFVDNKAPMLEEVAGEGAQVTENKQINNLL